MNSASLRILCLVVIWGGSPSAWAEVPLPSGVSFAPPAPELSKEIAAFLGGWEGNWSGNLEAVVIVEKFDGEIADVVYAWGDAPNWNVKRAYRRYKATVTPGKPELKFKGGSVEFVVSMNSDLSSIQVQRTANTGTATETFKRVAADEIARRAARQAASLIRSTIKQPGADVPAACAGFVGGWNGRWGGRNREEEWLWIVEVDANCTAKYNFGRHGYRGALETGEIRKGVLSTPCAAGGTCSFDLHGEDLWGSWFGIGTVGQNAIVLKKIQVEKQ